MNAINKLPLLSSFLEARYQKREEAGAGREDFQREYLARKLYRIQYKNTNPEQKEKIGQLVKSGVLEAKDRK